jgi:hypothetical protein
MDAGVVLHKDEAGGTIAAQPIVFQVAHAFAARFRLD